MHHDHEILLRQQQYADQEIATMDDIICRYSDEKFAALMGAARVLSADRCKVTAAVAVLAVQRLELLRIRRKMGE